MSRFYFPFFLILLLALLLFLQYRLWFESGSFKDMLQWQKKGDLQSAQNEKIKMYNAHLQMQIERLKKSSKALESRARNELGMIKKDETFYRIVP